MEFHHELFSHSWRLNNLEDWQWLQSVDWEGPWISCSNNHLFPEDLVTSLNQISFYYLNQVWHMEFMKGNTRWISE